MCSIQPGDISLKLRSEIISIVSVLSETFENIVLVGVFKLVKIFELLGFWETICRIAELGELMSNRLLVVQFSFGLSGCHL